MVAHHARFCGEFVERLLDDFGFRYPGIEQVEHAYYAVGAVDDATRRDYLQQAYRLGYAFESGLTDAGLERDSDVAGRRATGA